MMKKATKKGKRSNLREKKERASQDQERRGIRTVTRRSKGGVTRCSEIDRFVNNFILENAGMDFVEQPSYYRRGVNRNFLSYFGVILLETHLPIQSHE